MNELAIPAGWGRRLLRSPKILMTGFGMLAIVAMLLNVAADVALRNAANSPIQGTLEYITYWYMASITFVGFWLAQDRREHISVTLVTDRLNRHAQVLLIVLATIVSIVFLSGLSWFGFESALHYASVQEFTGATRVPVWPFRFLVPICLVGLIVSILLTACEDIRQKLSGPQSQATNEEPRS